MDLEINCVVSCIVLAAAITADALSALDPNVLNETPTSMRCSAIILAACLASPPIRQRFVFTQRLVLAVGLAAVALTGDHRGSEWIRIADAVFIFIISSTTLSSYMRGGVESLRSSKRKQRSLSPNAPEFTRRDSVCALAISMLFYTSFRVIRQAVSYVNNVETFEVATTSWSGAPLTSPGYAYVSVASVIALGFGGVVGVGLSATLLASNTLREVGTSSKRELMLIGGFLQFAAAFWASVALSEQQQVLTALFSASACNSETCPAAGAARRFALMNGGPTTLWINTLATLLLAYGPDSAEARPSTLSPVVVIWGLLSAVACAAVVFAYSSFSGPGIYVEISTLVALAGVTIAAFWDAELGSTLFAGAMIYDEAVSIMDSGLLLLTYLTHCSIFVGVFAIALRTAVVFVSDMAWRFCGPGAADVLEDVVGVLTIAGMSIFTFLYLATCGLLGTYSGILLGPDSYEEGPNAYARSLIAACLEHWVPILIFAPLYRSRQVTNIAFGWKLGVWVGTVVLTLGLWTAALAVAGRDAQHIDAYSWSSQTPFVMSVFFVCLIPWASVSLV